MLFRILIVAMSFSLTSAFANPHNIEDCTDSKNHFAHQMIEKLGKGPCGLLGSVDDRIDECKAKGAKADKNFVLVTRTVEGKEVYQDTETGMLWGDVLLQKMTHKQALKACRDTLAEVGRIAGRKWRLPTVEEVKDARARYNKDKKKFDRNKPLPLPNLDQGYQWTSSKSPHIKNAHMAFDEDTFYSDSAKEPLKVRCVAE